VERGGGGGGGAWGRGGGGGGGGAVVDGIQNRQKLLSLLCVLGAEKKKDLHDTGTKSKGQQMVPGIMKKILCIAIEKDNTRKGLRQRLLRKIRQISVQVTRDTDSGEINEEKISNGKGGGGKDPKNGAGRTKKIK